MMRHVQASQARPKQQKSDRVHEFSERSGEAMMDNTEKCELCGSEFNLTRHHLVPKLKAKNKYKEIRDDDSNILIVCRSCHDQIHALYSESQLRDLYSSKEALSEAPELKKFISWKKKHLDFKGHSKMSNVRRH